MVRDEETSIGVPAIDAGGTQQKEGAGDAATAGQPAGTATPAAPSWMDKLGMMYDAAQTEEETAKKRYEDSQARISRQQEAVKKATEEGTSLWASLLEKNKPVYDKKKILIALVCVFFISLATTLVVSFSNNNDQKLLIKNITPIYDEDSGVIVNNNEVVLMIRIRKLNIP